MISLLYILMNKNWPLCKISIDTEEHFLIEKILDVYADKKFFPIGVDIIAGRPQKKSLAKWWASRAIPGSRIGGNSFEHRYRINLAALPFKNYGLSLSDQYWIKPVDETVQWQDINFFANEFSLDLGMALFDRSYTSANLDYMSPDSTSDGMLPKKWIRDMKTQQTFLLKAGSGPFEQEPFNEVIASKIFELLNVVPYVKYQIIHENDRYLCSCANFITADTEFITANSMLSTKSVLTTPHKNNYDFFLQCCDAYNIPRAKEIFDVMLAVDYILCNYDRHFGNFGFIRNLNNLAEIRPAPIFDTGSCLWHKATLNEIGRNFEARSFCSMQDENARLITHFDLLDLSKLIDIDDLIKNELQKNINLPERRIDLIAAAAKEQLRKLQNIKDGK